MQNLELLKEEMRIPPESGANRVSYWMAEGYKDHFNDPIVLARAYAIRTVFEKHEKYVYANDLVVGSIRGKLMVDASAADLEYAKKIVSSYGRNHFITNADHYAADFETPLSIGIGGMLRRISKSREAHRGDADYQKKKLFLDAAETALRGFSEMISQYGRAAWNRAKDESDPVRRKNLTDAAESCMHISVHPPRGFRDALQLVWLIHVSFLYEERYAMALGRMDQYLYPFYRQDIDSGVLTRDRALELVECTLYKIGESTYYGGDDVVNIAIAGLKPDGTGGLNELSEIILEAVGNCNIPGPNLSARIYDGIPDEFLDRCLQVIGTGLGYPALMNDGVNIPALHRHGYSLEDSRNYCMVGCIENFIQGKQPPWSDGRYNVPKYIELALNRGVCMLTGVRLGPDTGDPAGFLTMEDFMDALRAQMVHGAAEYMALFRNENERYSRIAYAQPYLSCYCVDCIGRALDINDGGAVYPSVHGAGCMGIATVADSLAAVERVVYQNKTTTVGELREALLHNFEGKEELRRELLAAPKYGNNDDAADRYAVWYVELTDEIFSKYRTHDGGAIYTAIASNVSNIPAGAEVAATPDGRLSRSPLSDAASPMHGMDRRGPTAVVNSLTKPDYTRVSCGTVLNQKYSPSMFRDPAKRVRLLALVKTYFKKGGQEIQINAVSRGVLQDAMEHPEEYRSLVVRVSGFSAYYTALDRKVQQDILARTEHE